MKKTVSLIFILFFMTSCAGFSDDLWDNFGDQNIYGQKPVSDKEFEQALESKKKKKPKKNKDIPKGQELYKGSDVVKPAETPVILIPTTLIIEDTQIPTGHYQVEGEMKDGKPYLKFYQAHFLKAEIPAIETDDDFNQDNVNFVKLLDENEKQVKIIFGSLDFNAYSIINIAE